MKALSKNPQNLLKMHELAVYTLLVKRKNTKKFLMVMKNFLKECVWLNARSP